MKYLLLLGVIAGAIWLWRHNREHGASQQPRRPTPSATTVDMVACLHCGTHLPQTDAVRGTQGYYCGAEHRRRHEG